MKTLVDSLHARYLLLIACTLLIAPLFVAHGSLQLDILVYYVEQL